MSKKVVQDALRDQYINQVKQKNDNSNQIEEGGYRDIEPYTPSNNLYYDTEFDGETVEIQPGAYVPNIGIVGTNIHNDYKRFNVQTLSSVNMSIEGFNKTGSIALPNGDSTRPYVATMCAIIESTMKNGGMKQSEMFVNTATIRDNNGRQIFKTTINQKNIRDNGLYLRKDLVYYLKILFERVKGDINADYFTFTSMYRSIKYNYDLYTGLLSKGKVSQRTYWSSHMGAIAVDIGLRGKDRAIVADEAYKMGFGCISIGKGFIHLDINIKRYHKYAGVPKYIGPGNPGRNNYAT